MEHGQHDAGMPHMQRTHEMPSRAAGDQRRFDDSRHRACQAWPRPPWHRQPNGGRVFAESDGGTGERLEDSERRVLVYTDLKSLAPYPDQREPEREIELHLTGHMKRYMWSFDGKKYSEAKEPIPFRYGERLRLTFVNDTMMEHPLHLHGMWMHLENGAGAILPRKHTVIVKPAERLSVAITADAPGRWAFHCHLLLHMEAGCSASSRCRNNERKRLCSQSSLQAVLATLGLAVR